MLYALYAEQKLRTLYWTFGPHLCELCKCCWIRQSDRRWWNTVETLETMKEDCTECKKTSTEPQRFKLTFRTADQRIIHRVQVEIIFIRGFSIIHIVDKVTYFCSVSFLQSRPQKICNQIQDVWSLVYLRTSVLLISDQRTAYISKELREGWKARGAQLDKAPIERLGKIGTFKRYHAPVNQAYQRIRTQGQAGSTYQ